jgi:U3 small nucleolar RNA-associated protein 14
MRTYSVFLTILFLILLGVFIHKPSGHDQRLLELEAKYKNSIDSIRAYYRQLILEDSITFKEYQKAKYAQFKAEAEAKIWKQRYEKQRAVIVRYSDSELDSLLSAIR